MRAGTSIVLALAVLASIWSCGGSTGPGPISLYPGAPRPPAELSVINVVRTHPTRGHPTIDVRKITLLGDSSSVIFEAQAGGRGWAVPDHFGGLPDPGQRKTSGNPRDLPDHFEILPGLYQIQFLYVPAVDHLGWTHKRTTVDLTQLDCRAGYTYHLRGGLHPDGGGWILRVTAEPTG